MREPRKERGAIRQKNNKDELQFIMVNEKSFPIKSIYKYEPLETKNAENVLLNIAKRWIKRLTHEQIDAIKKYTKHTNEIANKGKFYERLNSYLQKGRSPNTKEEQRFQYLAERISMAIKKFKTQEDIISYRVVNKDVYDDRKIGEVFSEPRFTSTSISPSVLKRGKYKYVFLIRKGFSKGAYIASLSRYPKQREFLVDKNVKMKIVCKQQNTTIIEVLK